MKIYNENGIYVKLVPKKFEAIEGEIPTLTDTATKRLTAAEREKLEIELLKICAKNHLITLKAQEPFVHELIAQKAGEVDHLEKTFRKTDKTEFRLIFKKGVTIRVPHAAFKGVNYSIGYQY